MDNRLPEDVMLDEALRSAPEVRIPANFRQRLLTRLPETSAAYSTRRRWFWPAIGVLALLWFMIVAQAALQLGVQRWLMRPSMLLTTLGIEIVFSVALLWRAQA